MNLHPLRIRDKSLKQNSVKSLKLYITIVCMYVCMYSGNAGVGTRLLWDHANSNGGAANKLELLNHYYMGELGSTVLHCTLKLQVTVCVCTRMYVCMYVCMYVYLGGY